MTKERSEYINPVTEEHYAAEQLVDIMAVLMKMYRNGEYANGDYDPAEADDWTFKNLESAVVEWFNEDKDDMRHFTGCPNGDTWAINFLLVHALQLMNGMMYAEASALIQTAHGWLIQQLPEET